MDRTDEKLRELLSDKVGNWSPPVDPGLWAGVQSGMGSAASGATGSAALKGMTGLKWLGAAVLGSAIVAGVAYVLSDTAEKTPTSEMTDPIMLSANDAEIVTETDDSYTVDSEAQIQQNANEVVSLLGQDQREPVGDDTASNAMNQKTGNQPLQSDESIANFREAQPNVAYSKSGTSHTQSENRASYPSVADEQVFIESVIAEFSVLPSDDNLLTFRFTPVVLAESHHWMFGDGAESFETGPSHTFSEPGEYTVTHSAMNSSGESTTEKMTILAFPPGKLILPNIFSPNNDGVNDTYDVMSMSENITIHSIMIVSQKGETVYEFSEARPVWDGTDLFGIDCPVGAYFVTVIASDSAGEPIKESGTVRLKR